MTTSNERCGKISCVILTEKGDNFREFMAAGDFQRGLNKAVANGWITLDLRNGYRYQLTAKGFAVGRMIDRDLANRQIS